MNEKMMELAKELSQECEHTDCADCPLNHVICFSDGIQTQTPLRWGYALDKSKLAGMADYEAQKGRED